MKYLLDEWDNLKHDFLKGDFALFFDYDGTLVPIMQRPEQAVLADDMRDILNQLANIPQCHMAVISGRKLSNLKEMIDVPGITYVGNHGFEIEGSTINFETLISDEYKDDLAAIKEQLKKKLDPIDGVWLEDKELSVTVHFRQAGEAGSELARKIFAMVCHSYADGQRIEILEGKKVLEVRPPVKWNKGEAALWLLAKWQLSGRVIVKVLYAGDDRTDEDAFRLLGKAVLTVRVGEFPQSSARYFVRTQEGVYRLLRNIKETILP